MRPSKWINSERPMFPYEGMSYPMTSVLMNRGFHALHEINTFLEVSLDQLHPPEALPDMTLAVSRITRAIEQGETICIYGDYDVDGMTSVAILYRTLVYLNANLMLYIPKRMEEGYGLNTEAIQTLHERGATVVVTVDCGITAIEPAIIAKELGIDLIITDHHECQPELPQAYGIINPKLPGCTYPYDMLAGAGIALKLSMALLGEDFYVLSQDLLALSAIGTIADIAPLTGENRIIAKYGLEALTELAFGDEFPGIQALLKVCDLKEKTITAGHIGFMVGPRLNAIGRLEHAQAGADLLITEDLQRAHEIAKRLDDLNKERQLTEKQILDQAILAIESDPIHRSSGTIIVWGKGWHPGVVGIVASRLVEKYYRPVIVLCEVDGLYKGSARSIEGYSIFEALLSQKDWLTKFGGHEQAAGLTLSVESLPALIEGLKHYNQSHLSAECLIPKLRCDGDVISNEVNLVLLEELGLLEPYGVGNAKPIFRMQHLKVEESKRMGKSQEHLKLVLNDHYRLFEAVYFKYGDKPMPQKGSRVDVALQFDLNTWNGVDRIQLLLKDFRCYEPQNHAFNLMLEGIYLKKLLLWLMSNPGEFVASKLRFPEERMEQDVRQWLNSEATLAIWSYDALLEVAYLMHDQALPYLEAIDHRIEILPINLAEGSIALDIPLDTQNTPYLFSANFKRLDHSHTVRLANSMVFDRMKAQVLFSRLKRESEIYLDTYLIASEDRYSDIIAMAFFVEANFAFIEGKHLKIQPGPYQKMQFEDSRIAKTLDRFKKGVRALENYMKGFREL